jgi:penicillin-binding protein 1A
MKQAILAAEDERFYQHPGVDTIGVLRAAYANFTSGGKRQGASTITMQVARNFFLSSEKTLARKLYEALLAFKIENNLSKDEILEIYINQIYLGQRAYGFAAASQIYFGKPLKSISIAEAAMLAGLPKAPSSFNPVANPKRAKQRQLYVLRRMRELGFINDAQMAEAQKQDLRIKRDVNEFGVRADYVAEMARQIAYRTLPGRGLHPRPARHHHHPQGGPGGGLCQPAARGDRLRQAPRLPRRQRLSPTSGQPGTPLDEALEEALQDEPDSGRHPCRRDPRSLSQAGEGLSARRRNRAGDRRRPEVRPAHARRQGAGQQAPASRRRHLRAEGRQGHWQIVQLPEVEAAFVAASPTDGAIRALVGGFDFNRNKFNHVTQAWRQPGSSFKPFIYSAALEKGFTPASVIQDEPLICLGRRKPAARPGSRRTTTASTKAR